MKTKLTFAVLSFALFVSFPFSALANRDGFNDVVKAIERFYNVKHQGIPFLARAGMTAMRAAAKVKGGEWKRLAEAGSVRVAIFEDQSFDSRGQIATFKASVQSTLSQDWSPLVQTLAPKDEEQTYIYLREAGTKFHVLVITIMRRDATVVQATLKPDVLAQLLKDPDEMGKSITDDATLVDP
ncbi:MAG: hypothetical protein ACXW18_09010 [Pyrinomonadaceae bacterium]